MGVFLMGCPTVKEDTGPGPRVDIEEAASVTWTGGEELEEAGQGVAVLDDWNGAPAIAISAPGLKRVYVEPIPEPGEYVLPTGEGLTIETSQYIEFGSEVASPGDITGDGLADILVTADDSYQGPEAFVSIIAYDAGGFVSVNGAEPRITVLCENSRQMEIWSGYAISDAVPDAIVSCPNEYGGFVALYRGPLWSDTDTTKAYSLFTSEDEGWFGAPVRADSDLDGNGVHEVLIASSYTLYAFSNPGRGVNTDNDADTTINGGIFFSEAFVSGFDDNNDGYTDLLVSDPSWLPDPWDCKHEGVGAVWLYHGPLTGHLDAQDAAVATLRDTSMTWGNEECIDNIGASLTYGDFNDDGQVDYAIGNTVAYTRPSVYIVRGPLSGAIELGEDSLGIEESYYSPYTAEVMETAVLDADGSQDLLIGDPGWITELTTTGEQGKPGAVYLFPGADITSLAGW